MIKEKKEISLNFGFENLLVYKKSLDYIDFVYALTVLFPQNESFNLTSQFNRAACSIALNIGEGSGGTTKEFTNFIRIAYRSINECAVCTSIAYNRKYISVEQYSKSRLLLDEMCRMLSGLKASINRKSHITLNSKPSTN